MVGIALVVIAAVACVGAMAQPAMALATGQDCAGPACDDQITCGQPAPPLASSGSFASLGLVAILAASTAQDVEQGAIAIAPAPSCVRPASQPFAPFAPRSPPSA
jgi:hypothetical protein